MYKHEHEIGEVPVKLADTKYFVRINAEGATGAN
jgi:hypothetical protein